MNSQKQIGLALSGGGYRAAVYHLGTLRKLHQLKILDKIDRFSTISGGSITGAAYCLHKGEFEEFERRMFKTLTTKSIILYILTSWEFIRVAITFLALLGFSYYLAWTDYAPLSIPLIILVFCILIKYQFVLLPISAIIEKAYDKFFYSGAKLSDLNTTPEIAIGSTNLQTLRQFTFSRRKMEDSLYAYQPQPVFFDGTNFPVARAVIASSSVPFAFTPISIAKEFYKNPAQYGTINPKLVDGGVYDNQGAHKLTQENSSYKCDIVIISDAGNKLPFEKAYNNTFNLLLRTVDTFMARIKHFQMIQNIYSKKEISVSFQSVGWDLKNCISGFHRNLLDGNISKELCAAHKFENQWIETPEQYKKEIIAHLENVCDYKNMMTNALNDDQLKDIRGTGTNLTPIKETRAKNLMAHAELITELQIKLYTPQLLEKNAI